MLLRFQPRSKVLKKNYINVFKNKVYRSNNLRFNCVFGFKVLESGNLFFKEVNAVKKSLQSLVKGKGFLYHNLHFNQSLTKKSLGSRMGKGKGKIDVWFCKVTAGMLIFEIDIPVTINVYKVLLQIKEKLSLKTKIIFYKKN